MQYRTFTEYATSEGRGRTLHRLHGLRRDTANGEIKATLGDDFELPQTTLERLSPSTPTPARQPIWFDGDGNHLPNFTADMATLEESAGALFADHDLAVSLLPKRGLTTPPRFATPHEFLVWHTHASDRAGGDEALTRLIDTEHRDAFIHAIEEIRDAIHDPNPDLDAPTDGAGLLRTLLEDVAETPGRTEPGDPAAAVREAGEEPADERGSDLERPGSASPPVVRDRDVADEPTPLTDFHADAPLATSGGEMTRARGNLAAIRLLNELGDRPATVEEQEVLAEYVGWGGIPSIFDESKANWSELRDEFKSLVSDEAYAQAATSTLNAHYTTVPIVQAIYGALGRAGYNGGGAVLDAGCGTGHFFSASPHADETRTGVELDATTARIAAKLHPSATIEHGGFETFQPPLASFDLTVGNPPFGDYAVHDPEHADLARHTIHNYFIAKQTRLLKPGGIGAFVVSRYFLDALDDKTRKLIHQSCDLLGATRLPNTAFAQNAATQVVADVVVFRKRLPHESAPKELPDWIVSDRRETPSGEQIPLNRYIHADGHNETRMVGKPVYDARGMYGDNAYEVQLEEPLDQTQMGAALEKALSFQVAGDHYQPLAATVAETDGTAELAEMLTETVKTRAEFGTIALDEDGNAWSVQKQSRFVRRGENDPRPIVIDGLEVEPLAFKPSELQRLGLLLEIRDLLRPLVEAESRLDGNDKCERLRRDLNAKVEAFRAKYRGAWNSHLNQRLLREDADAPLVMSLIDDTPDAPSQADDQSVKATILQRRVTYPAPPEIRTKDLAQAYLVATATPTAETLDERVARLMEIDTPAARSQLLRAGLAFDDGTGTLIGHEEYLSGDIAAKLHALDELPNADALSANRTALEHAMPDPVPFEAISTPLGATWIPPEIYLRFAKEVLKCRTNGKLHMSDQTMRFALPETFYTNSFHNHTSLYGTHRVNSIQLFERTLNGQPIEVRTTREVDGERKSVFDKKETHNARLAQGRMRDAFAEWLDGDPALQAELAATYNNMFNSTVSRQWNGDHLQLGDIDRAGITLRANQRNGIMRCIAEPDTLVNHVVGSGKTFIGAVAEIEKQKAGLASKSMIVAPNHLTGQWANEILRLYPQARVLTLDRFDKPKRQKFLAKIATGKWDFIVCPESSFKMIPTSRALQERFIREELAALDEDIKDMREEGAGTPSVKKIGKLRTQLANRLTTVLNKKEDPRHLTWENLGIDSLVIDEAHGFKNLAYQTLMRGIAGLSPAAGSEKAADLAVKIRHMREQPTRTSRVFLTGTPISNSLAESYHMLSYLHPDGLKKRNSHTFDAFIRNFAEVESDWEVGLTGTNFIERKRLAKFTNTPELQSLWNEVADNCSLDDLHKDFERRYGKRFPVPKIKDGGRANDSAPPDDLTEMATEEIVQRMAEQFPADGSDNALKCMTDGRRRALDMRLEFPAAEPNPRGKTARAARNIVRIAKQWESDKGAQLVFCDTSTPKQFRNDELRDYETVCRQAAEGDPLAMQNQAAMERAMSHQHDFDVYNELKREILAQANGALTADEIAFVHEANTPKRKERLFDKVNKGEVRVLVGSTWKMGTGMNVQERLVALHHLDAPWRPADMQQREGRIERQGNLLYERDPDNFEVEVRCYTCERTADAKMYQTLETKAAMLESFFSGDEVAREVEDLSASDRMSYAEIKALTASNPKILEEIQTRKAREETATRLKDLQERRAKAARDVKQLPNMHRHFDREIAKKEALIEQIKALPPLSFQAYDPDSDKVKPIGRAYETDLQRGDKETKTAFDGRLRDARQKALTAMETHLRGLWKSKLFTGGWGRGNMQTVGTMRGLTVNAHLRGLADGTPELVVELYDPNVDPKHHAPMTFARYENPQDVSAQGLNQRLANLAERGLPDGIAAARAQRDERTATARAQAKFMTKSETELAELEAELIEREQQVERLQAELGIDEQGGERKDYTSDYPPIELTAGTGVAINANNGEPIRPLTADDRAERLEARKREAARMAEVEAREARLAAGREEWDEDDEALEVA